MTDNEPTAAEYAAYLELEAKAKYGSLTVYAKFSEESRRIGRLRCVGCRSWKFVFGTSSIILERRQVGIIIMVRRAERFYIPAN